MEQRPDDIILQIPLFIDHSKQGSYFTLPFALPDGIEKLSLAYRYDQQSNHETPAEHGVFVSHQRTNTIDLGLIAPDGTQVGVSGSAKQEIFISETSASPGYHPCRLTPGKWQIIVGAYKVAEEGVHVLYELTFSPQYRRVLKGDLHTHTQASDGALPLQELVQRAKRNGLDFLAITDHNTAPSPEALLQYHDITLIPGMEWTHFRGHAGFLGLEQPFEGLFYANGLDEVRAHFDSAHERGALIIIDHPKDGVNPFEFDVSALPFDCIEAWKGFFLEYNHLALAWWKSMLLAGKKIPICGGSDYHEDVHNRFPGAPCTCVYAMSASSSDILSALKSGHAYITFRPDAPSLEMTAGDAIMGDSVEFSRVKKLEYTLLGLTAGDSVMLITNTNSTLLGKAETSGDFSGEFQMEYPGFAWIEVHRQLLPSIPLLPVLISNPIYFDDR